MTETDTLYVNRKLSHGYPNLEGLGHDRYVAHQQSNRHAREERETAEKLLRYLGRLMDLEPEANILVLGCGPQPEMIKALRQRGFHAVGVEPVPSSVETARRYVGQPDSILLGAAEKIPLSDESQQLVVCLYVLEHVDSPVRCLSEMNRVLVPGGVNVIYTTNRHHISLLGRNGEFSIPYYNWFPDLLKECYVHHHLHFDPQLANYTTRPAVHWFCYSALCKLGRDACFSQFYSIIDVLRVEDPLIAKSPFRRFLLPRLQRSPWLRALALTQVGGMVLMVKRPA